MGQRKFILCLGAEAAGRAWRRWPAGAETGSGQLAGCLLSFPYAQLGQGAALARCREPWAMGWPSPSMR